MEFKYSGVGIASFVISIASGFFMFVLIIIAGMIEVSTPGGIDEESAEAIVIGLFVFAFLFLSIVALALGIVGLVQSDRKKVFPALGAVFSALTLIGTVFLIVIGAALS